jgi:hypothetical protein
VSAGATQCISCPSGKYNTVADSSCESCSAGSFTTRTANDNDGWGSLYSSRYCYPCPAGKHNPTADQSCGSCSSGKFTADASGVGVSTGATQCNDCPLGKYNTVADSSCESCSAGHFTTRTSSDRDGSGHQTSSSYCNACPAGMHNPTGDHICDDCSAGYFTAGSAADNDGVGVIDGATHCNLCPAGSYSFGTSSSFFSGGHQVTAQWCRPCSPGRYEPAAGQADDCSQQHTTYQCVPGFGWSGSTTIDDGNCAVCQPGRYSSVTATAVCTACSAGSMTDGLGEAGTGYMVAQQKASTTYLPKCWDPGALASVTCCRDVNGNSNGACPASGSTQPFGLRNCASICTEAAGLGTAAGGGVTIGSFLQCVSQVNYSEAVRTCAANNARLCTRQELGDCAEGSGCGFNSQYVWSSTSCSPTGQGSTSCTNCGGGQYSARSTRACSQCFAGSWASKRGRYVSGFMTAVNSNANTQCIGCTGSAGSFDPYRQRVSCTNGSTHNCQLHLFSPLPQLISGRNDTSGGFHTDTLAAPGGSICTKCARGQFTTNPAVACANHTIFWCAPGYGWSGSYDRDDGACAECPPARYNGASDSSACISCPAGYETNVGNLNRGASCTRCIAGRFSSMSNVPCTQCPAGTYQQVHGSTSCTSCPQGSRTNIVVAATQCNPCTAGQFTQSSYTDCQHCPTGQYQPSTGRTACIACASGSYTNTLGQAGVGHLPTQDLTCA